MFIISPTKQKGGNMTNLEKQQQPITVKDVILDIIFLIMMFGSAILLLAL